MIHRTVARRQRRLHSASSALAVRGKRFIGERDEKMKQANIAVIFGGCSSEYSVSLESAHAVITHMDRQRYRPVPVGITREGRWLAYFGETGKIADDTWHKDESCAPAAYSPERGDHSLLLFRGKETERISIDAAFPVLHGKNGEDGTIQGLFELTATPLVGCGTLASALCMDKDRAHRLAASAGADVPRSFVLGRRDDPDEAARRAEKLGFPVFVKPVKAGSSYGITRVTSPEFFGAAVNEAFLHDDQVIVEETIPGFETGCAVMGNDDLITGEIDEIELQDGFFDFTEKYNLITSSIHVPARITPAQTQELKDTAKRIYRALGCSGFARVDMFLTPEGRVVFNEVNTIPGFTAHSRFPIMMKAVGMTFDEIITRAVELAFEKQTGGMRR